MKRVIFFSKQDMASGWMLDNAEVILNGFQESHVYTDINDIIELYQIKKYFDVGLFLDKWSANQIDQYKDMVSKFWSKVNMFYNEINNDNVEAYFNDIDIQYSDAFWLLIDKCNVYKRIPITSFVNLLNEYTLRDILKCENIVNHYNLTIKEFLVNYNSTAEIILSKYEKDSESDNTKIYLPKSLTVEDKNSIFDKYLDWKDANLNYIGLIVIAKNSSELNIPDTLRLKAKRRKKADTEALLNANSVGIGYQVSFSESQVEPLIANHENFTLSYSYSASLIKVHSDSISLFLNFQRLFCMIDSQSRITLVSKKSEKGLIDLFGVHSVNKYPNGFAFQSKNNVAFAQMYAYYYFLDKELGISLENVIIDAFNEDVMTKKILNLSVNLLSNTSSSLERVRFLVPEMESLMKKYKLYVENGVIDLELLSISSTPCSVQNIPSKIKKKYAYVINEKIGYVLHHFFSDQSMMYYVKPYHGKYHSLYDLLINEDILLDALENYQLPVYQNLISEQYLKIENGIVKINNPCEIKLYKDLYENEVISYHRLSPTYRDILDNLHENGCIEFGDTLLSKPEIKYFNFLLNKSEYTNGYDLRNKYVHGAHNHKPEVIEQDYYRLLILFALLEWKIIDDIYLSQINI